MRANSRLLLSCKAALAASAPTAAVPPNYSNIPYKKQQDSGLAEDEDDVHGPGRMQNLKKKDSTQFTSSSLSASVQMRHALSPAAVLPPPPSPLRSTFIEPSRAVTSTNSNYKIKSFRHTTSGTADVSIRPLQFLPFSHVTATASAKTAKQQRAAEQASSFGERLRDQLSCRWAAKFYGQVTYGPRNYPYPSSRWLARRFKMKKHKIIKRFRFRRYKLAAVANLPFAKMIRVGMLPELKSSKTKKGDAVEAGLSAQLVSAVKSSTGGKTKGRRTRPKSKYQV